MLTIDDCKMIIKKIGSKFNVDPALISTRLLSKEDKQDMLDGKVPIETLVTAVKVWKAAGMPDYANGDTTPYKRR